MSFCAGSVSRFLFDANRINQDDDSTTHSLIIIDESMSVSVVEKIMPLVFSKLSHQKSHLVHSLTFGADEAYVVEKLQSLSETLDANKQIRVLVLTDREVQNCQEIESLAATIMKFLSGSNFPAHVQILRFGSKCRLSLRRINNTTICCTYKHFEIDVNESDDSIISRIAELFGSTDFPLHSQLHTDLRICKIQGHSTAIIAEYAWDVGVNRLDDLQNIDYVESAEFRSEMKRQHRRSDRVSDVIDTVVVVNILFFLLFLLFQLFYYFVVTSDKCQVK